MASFFSKKAVYCNSWRRVDYKVTEWTMSGMFDLYNILQFIICTVKCDRILHTIQWYILRWYVDICPSRLTLIHCSFNLIDLILCRSLACSDNVCWSSWLLYEAEPSREATSCISEKSIPAADIPNYLPFFCQVKWRLPLSPQSETLQDKHSPDHYIWPFQIHRNLYSLQFLSAHSVSLLTAHFQPEGFRLIHLRMKTSK